MSHTVSLHSLTDVTPVLTSIVEVSHSKFCEPVGMYMLHLIAIPCIQIWNLWISIFIFNSHIYDWTLHHFLHSTVYMHAKEHSNLSKSPITAIQAGNSQLLASHHKGCRNWSSIPSTIIWHYPHRVTSSWKSHESMRTATCSGETFEQR